MRASYLIIISFLFFTSIGSSGELYPCRCVCEPVEEQTTWYKNLSDSTLKQLDNGVLVKPVKKPLTIHTYFEPVKFEIGKKITFKMRWKSDGYKGSDRDFDCTKQDPEGKGKGIGDNLLRCLAGTGDFRMGFFDSTKKVTQSGWCDGNKNKNKCEGQRIETRFNDYPGFQVRFQPHLHSNYNDIERLRQRNSNEPHTNIAMWTRLEHGENGLMSDECQNINHCGFKRDSYSGEPPQGYGPNTPFGKEVDLIFEVTRTKKDKYEVYLILNGVKSKKMDGDFNSKFMPSEFDTFAITYTNSSRRYDYIQVTDFKVD